MNLERYPYFAADDYQIYRFSSEGPKGRIDKMVAFTRIPNTYPIVYNLGFGDLNPATGDLDDKIISNNKDRDIVLATVASTIINFCDHYGNQFIYAVGSTPARTRLYQMGIAAFWQEINKDFEVYGRVGDDWHYFVPYTINYGAFLVKRK